MVRKIPVGKLWSSSDFHHILKNLSSLHVCILWYTVILCIQSKWNYLNLLGLSQKYVHMKLSKMQHFSRLQPALHFSLLGLLLVGYLCLFCD